MNLSHDVSAANADAARRYQGYTTSGGRPAPAGNYMVTREGRAERAKDLGLDEARFEAAFQFSFGSSSTTKRARRPPAVRARARLVARRARRRARASSRVVGIAGDGDGDGPAPRVDADRDAAAAPTGGAR